MVLISLALQFIISSLVIVVAGIFLVRASDTISGLTKIGKLFAGSILLAGATSLPELLVDINAIQKGMPDLAVGDLMGSSLSNLFILAVADLFHRNPQKIFSKASAQHALSAIISINMTTIACIAIFLGPHMKHLSLGEVGLGPILIVVFYFLGIRLLRHNQSDKSSDENPPVRGGLIQAWLIYFASAVFIFVAAPYLAESAGEIADRSGLGKTFIGTTLVAFCTSLPEVVSTFTAIRMGAFDLAVGNIFGSNAFNMLLLAPLDFFHAGNLLGSVSRSHILTALFTMVATSVAIAGQLYQVEKKKKFVEPDAFTVMAVVITALIVLFAISKQ